VLLCYPPDTSTLASLWAKTANSLRRNRARRETLLASIRPLPGTGLLAGLHEASVLNQMVEMIVRGLYWKHYQTRLPLDCEIQIDRLDPSADISAMVSAMYRRSIAGGQFCYAVQNTPEHPTVSLWVLLFHDRLLAMAVTDRALAAQVSPSLVS
jgi:hypothetical protein